MGTGSAGSDRTARSTDARAPEFIQRGANACRCDRTSQVEQPAIPGGAHRVGVGARGPGAGSGRAAAKRELHKLHLHATQRHATGVYIANNGVHEYISQGIAHEALGFGSVPDYQRAMAAQALAKARAEIAARGLVVTVVQAFYGLLAAQAKTVSTSRPRRSAALSRHQQKLETGGEVAHSDVIKAQIQANDLQRQLQDTKLAEENARLALAVLVFPNFFQDFTLVNDLAAAPALPAARRSAGDGEE